MSGGGEDGAVGGGREGATGHGGWESGRTYSGFHPAFTNVFRVLSMNVACVDCKVALSAFSGWWRGHLWL